MRQCLADLFAAGHIHGAPVNLRSTAAVRRYCRCLVDGNFGAPLIQIESPQFADPGIGGTEAQNRFSDIPAAEYGHRVHVTWVLSCCLDGVD
jgi:hypothetical protein